jgi:acyl dehydratase
MLYFEDFAPGWVRRFDGSTVSAADIIAFARRFDAQSFHIDPVAAKASFAGELIASGWQTCGLLMRTIADGFILDSASMGSPGIEEVRWLRPLRPGDSFSVTATVTDARPSGSKPDRGLIRFTFVLLNQKAEPVLEWTNWIMIGRRDTNAPVAPRVKASASLRYVPPAVPSLPVLPAGQVEGPRRWFDDLEIGERRELGSYLFTADEIIAFARIFDPQPFHIDAEAAKHSSFGALCASGWHTAAVWMMLMIAGRDRQADLAGPDGPRLGSSPGFRNLKWLKPVYAGDTLIYSTEVIDRRETRSRPGWGLVFNRNSAVNQNGELVFQFDGCVFWERRSFPSPLEVEGGTAKL